MDNYGNPMTGDMMGSHVAGVPPHLGTPIPGTTGGLAAKPGLSVTQNPMAQELQSKGRGQDSMLVHMTPGEVGGLQNLAMAHGGSLTINPHTGLPEAGFLSNILPTLLGVGLSFIPGVGPLMAAGLTGIGTTAVTGDISKGLMAGLSAFGGASLAGAAGIGAAGEAAKTAATTAAPAATGNALTGVTTPGISGEAAKLASANIPGAPTGLGTFGGSMAPLDVSVTSGAPFGTVADQLAQQGAGQAAKTGLPGVLQRFGQTASAGFKPGSMLAKYAPYAAGLGLTNSISAAMQPTIGAPQQDSSDYNGPYMAAPRKIRPTESGPGGEIQFFDVVNPVPAVYSLKGAPPPGYAEGGEAAASAKPALADYVRMFQTSPGAITAPTAYPGGSPSALIRAAAKANGKEIDYGLNKNIAMGTGAGMGAGAGAGTAGQGALGDTSSNVGGLGSNYSGGMNGLDLNAMYGNLIPSQGTPASAPSWSPVTLGNGQQLTLNGPAPAPFDFTLGGALSDLVGGSGSGTKDNYPQGVSLGLGTPTDVGLGLQGFGPLGSSPSMADPYAGLAGDDQAEQTNDTGGGGSRYTTPEDKNAITRVAKGGTVNMKDGAFVVDARTVSELGNGSSGAGIDHLSRMGGRPVRGSGDGVSDSIPARIGGTQEARVARDEVVFSPEAVARVGGGDHKRGTQKLYALMEKAHKARKQAKRGQDTGVAKGLGALR